MTKLKATEVAAVRTALLAKQQDKCGLCGLGCSESSAVLDHCHTTGRIRGTLHRSCNSLLGKVENNYRRYGVTNLAAFLHGCVTYLQRHETDRTGYTHPTHRTDEEKRALRNTRARKARAAKKAVE